MSAVNPLPASGVAAGTEKRSYEPSMEEILASIRRIIADDQSIPKHPSIDAAASAFSGEIAQRPAPASSEPVPFPDLRPTMQPSVPGSDDAPASSAAAGRSPLDEPPAPGLANAPFGGYEPISAPQFPAPHGPVGDDVSVHPLVEQASREETVASLADHPGAGHPGIDHSGIDHSSVREPAAEASAAPAAREPEPQPAFHETPSLGDDDALYDTPIAPPKRPAATHAPSGLFSEATDSSVSTAFNMLAATRLADNSDELLNLAREMIRPLLRSWLDDNLPSMVERMVRSEIERVARGGR